MVNIERFQKIIRGDSRGTPEWEKSTLVKMSKGGKYLYHEKLSAYTTDDPKQGGSYTLAMEVRVQGNKKQYRIVRVTIPSARVAESLGGYLSDWHDFATAWND